MREQEMRLRAFRFLKARMRNMIMPAAMGIGLATGACTSTPVSKYMGPLPSDAALVSRDVSYGDVPALGPEAAPSETYEAPVATDVPDTGQDVSTPADQAVPDQAPAGDAVDAFADASADVPAPLDGKPDLWFPEGGLRYEGPMPRPDASLDIGIDTGGEAGPIIAKYIAPMPDAALDLGLTVRYMAQMPDSGA